MYTRFVYLRKSLNLTQKEFGEKLGVSRDVIKNIELNLNKKPIQNAFIKLVCSTYNVNEDWLRDGVGEMFQSNDEITASIRQSGKLSPQALSILERFMNMAPDKQDELIDTIKDILND